MCDQKTITVFNNSDKKFDNIEYKNSDFGGFGGGFEWGDSNKKGFGGFGGAGSTAIQFTLNDHMNRRFDRSLCEHIVGGMFTVERTPESDGNDPDILMLSLNMEKLVEFRKTQKDPCHIGKIRCTGTKREGLVLVYRGYKEDSGKPPELIWMHPDAVDTKYHYGHVVKEDTYFEEGIRNFTCE